MANGGNIDQGKRSVWPGDRTEFYKDKVSSNIEFLSFCATPSECKVDIRLVLI